MGLVLGLSMSSKDVRGVLVDGDSGEGAQVDSSFVNVDDSDAFDAEAFLKSLLADEDPHTIGLTWSADAEPAAIKVREALEVLTSGAEVVAVPDVEAAEALARGIADLTGYDFLIVCVVESDAAVIATVDGFRVAVERVERADFATLPDRALAVARSARPSPDAIFVLGSADTDELVATLTEAMPRPVITATEADFALTRGAALASAQATTVAEDEPVGKKRRFSRVGVLTTTLAAAVVVFVASVALLIGLDATGEQTAQPPRGGAEGPAVRPPAAIPPPAPPPTARDTPALRLDREPFASAILPAPAAMPPAAPAAAPPPAPAAPPAPAPKPRLRDRILSKIPGLNRLG